MPGETPDPAFKPPGERPPPTPVPMPAEIGGYRVQRVIGQGGMATVYAAMQTRPRRTVAVKVMREDVGGETALRRFRRESEILGKLRHPNIAQIFEAGTCEDGGRTLPFIVMEYIPRAMTLLQFMEARGLDTRARLRLLVQVCAAIGHGHRRKVIHRDLKPSNVLVDEAGQVKVIDFGVATARAAEDSIESSNPVGTIRYMSPEQLDRSPRDIDPRCDVYALGVMIYEALTGELPYRVAALPAAAAGHIIRTQKPVPPSSVSAEVRGDLEAIILRALRKDPAKRYAHAESLGRDLVRYLERRPIHGRRSGPLHRARLFARRHRAPVAAVATVAAVLAVAGGVLAVVSIRSAWRRAGLEESVARERAARREAEEALREQVAAPMPAAAPRRPFRFAQQAGDVHALAFSDDGSRLASGAADHTVVVFDVAGREPVFATHDHDAAVDRLVFSSDGRRLVTAGADGGIVVVDPAGVIERRLPRGFGPIHGLALAPGGRTLAIGADDLTLRVLEIDGAAAEPLTLRGTRGRFSAAAFDRAGARLAGGTTRGALYAWDTASGERIFTHHGPETPVEGLAFAPGERLVAVAGDGAGLLVDLSEPRAEPVRFAAVPGPLVAVGFAPDGRFVLAAAERSIVLWDLAGATPRAAWRHTSLWPLTAVAVAPDGSWCAIGGASGEIDVQPIDPV